ncbi:MAG: diguanylate cyclase [Clostridia bacterium]|nr:diguanylate cyclase [Clostridia bacterium]
MDKIKESIYGTSKKRNLAKEILQIAASFVIMLALTFVVAKVNVPNPNMVLIAGLVIFTSLLGFGAGIICGLDMIIYSMWFFSTDHSFFKYTSVNLQKMAVIIFGVVVCVVFIGNLNLRRRRAVRELNETNEKLMFDNAMLSEASMTDPLTGVKNRFAFRTDYSEKYHDRPVHVMMLDLDDFKAANDIYGHACGDAVLKGVGGAISDIFGEEFCYRYGGDEFLIVRTDVSEEEFCAMLDDMSEKIGGLTIPGYGEKVRFSAGYVYGPLLKREDLRLMIRMADDNLYKSKNSGKAKISGSRYSRAEAEKLPTSPRRDEER